MPLRQSTRRGFTILEIIVALLLVSALGIAVTKLIVGQARSFQRDNGQRRARTTSRSAMNILISDLRMTQDNGGITQLDATNNRRIDVRVPLAFGIVCEVNGATNAVIALAPIDTFALSSAKYGGWAVRNSATGIYTYSTQSGSDTISTTTASRCHGNGVNIYADTILAGTARGKIVLVTPGIAGAVVGAPAFIWQTVTYEFKASTMYPGRFGMYRVIRGRANTDTLSEELLAPFASTARFNYYTNGFTTRDHPTSTTPASPYNNVRGIQIYLPAVANDTVPGRTGPDTATTTTAVFFKNTRIQ